MSNVPPRGSVAAPAARRLINPGAPQPPGQIISPEALTPIERELLAQAGVDCSKPMPDDLSERLQMDLADLPENLQQAVNTIADQLPPDFTLPAGDLQLKGEEEVLSAAELNQALGRYTSVVHDFRQNANKPATVASPARSQPVSQTSSIHAAIEAARQQGVTKIRQSRQLAGISPNIAEALGGLPEEDEVVPQPAAASPQPAAKPTGAQAPASSATTETPEELAAKREAAREELLAKIRQMVPPAEVERYRESIITFTEYKRSFVLADGAVEIVFRDYGGEENDMLVLQEAIDRRKNRSPQHDLAAQLHNSNKYMLALCLVSIASKKQGTTLVRVPHDYPLLSYLESMDLKKLPGYNSDPDDTPLHAWAGYLMRYVLRGSIYSLMMQSFSTFLSDLEGMKRLSRERDFF